MPLTNKRQTILDVAVSVMTLKGKDSTISEIADKAGVTDSVIYHFFKNKDDLLFFAAGEYFIRFPVQQTDKCDPVFLVVLKPQYLGLQLPGPFDGEL